MKTIVGLGEFGSHTDLEMAFLRAILFDRNLLDALRLVKHATGAIYIDDMPFDPSGIKGIGGKRYYAYMRWRHEPTRPSQSMA